MSAQGCRGETVLVSGYPDDIGMVEAFADLMC